MCKTQGEIKIMAMSIGGQNLLNYLKGKKGVDVTAQDAAEALGVKLASITGSFNAMVKKGLGERVEAEVALEDGTHKKVKFLVLTDAGMNFDPTVEVEDK